MSVISHKTIIISSIAADIKTAPFKRCTCHQKSAVEVDMVYS